MREISFRDLVHKRLRQESVELCLPLRDPTYTTDTGGTLDLRMLDPPTVSSNICPLPTHNPEDISEINRLKRELRTAKDKITKPKIKK